MNESLAARTARQYVDEINAVDPVAVAALFAEDGEWIGQLEAPHRGAAELTALYGRLLAKAPPFKIIIHSQVTEGDRSVVLLARQDDPEKILAVDDFEVNEQGKIARLLIYGPPRTE